MQRQHQFARRPRFAPGRVEDRQHRLHPLETGLDRLSGAAGRLDRQGVEEVALCKAALFLHPADLEHLATEPDHHHAAHVGIGGVAPLGARQHVEAFALARHAAAGAVNEGDDAVDVGIVVEHARLLDLARHIARHRRRTIHRGQDAEIVARSGLAAGAREALERRLALDRQDRFAAARPRRSRSRDRNADRAIVLVHPLARRDRRRGEADDLAELAHRLARRDRRRGELMAFGHPLDARSARRQARRRDGSRRERPSRCRRHEGEGRAARSWDPQSSLARQAEISSGRSRANDSNCPDVSMRCLSMAARDESASPAAIAATIATCSASDLANASRRQHEHPPYPLQMRADAVENLGAPAQAEMHRQGQMEVDVVAIETHAIARLHRLAFALEIRLQRLEPVARQAARRLSGDLTLRARGE